MNFFSKKINVLLADDDPTDHGRFQLALNRSGHPVKIESVYNGIKLIDYLNQTYNAGRNPANPDLIITDLYMPFAGGLQVLKQIRKNQNFKAIPIYVFSANNDMTIKRNVLENGATGFYQKPLDFADLQVIINHILSGKVALA
jgi:CheY-like chemotaxis protein